MQNHIIEYNEGGDAKLSAARLMLSLHPSADVVKTSD